MHEPSADEQSPAPPQPASPGEQVPPGSQDQDPDQQAFVAELDDVVDVLKQVRGHTHHAGWSLRSPDGLVCGCGAVLYAADAARRREP